jgi:coatomer subunit delta
MYICKMLILFLVFMQMERGKLDKGGYSSISGPRVIEKTYSDMSISGTGFGSGSGLGGLNTDMGPFASKPKGDINLSIFS